MVNIAYVPQPIIHTKTIVVNDTYSLHSVMVKQNVNINGFILMLLATNTVFIRIKAWASISYKWIFTRRLNKSGVYSNPDIYFLLFTDQGRMADANTSVVNLIA